MVSDGRRVERILPDAKGLLKILGEVLTDGIRLVKALREQLRS
jgi:hypothetical protein